MPGSPDPVTRATRFAANVAAASVVAFALLWLLTTQIADIRTFSPFADDPWDAVATYAAIFLPFVAGPTWIRSLSHRDRTLPLVVARRIRWGSGLAAAIVLAASAADLHAIATVGWPANATTEATWVTTLVVLTISIALAGVTLTGRAAATARSMGSLRPISSGTIDPDVVDDLLDLTVRVARIFGLQRPAEHLAADVERFLDDSAVSPRRHRIVFGVLLAAGAAAAFDVWHTIREGPWANLVVPVVFGVLIASGILAIYLGTLGPLRLLRPPARDQADAPP
jgi:hypothetical protein